MSLLEVTDLSVRFGPAAVVDDVSFSVDRGETLARGGRERVGQVAHRALSSCACCRLPRKLSGRVLLDGHGDADPRRPTGCGTCAAGVAGMIFQEPMTSLNPLHRRSAGRWARRWRCMAAGRAAPPWCALLAVFLRVPDAERTGWTRCRTSFPAASGSG